VIKQRVLRATSRSTLVMMRSTKESTTPPTTRETLDQTDGTRETRVSALSTRGCLTSFFTSRRLIQLVTIISQRSGARTLLDFANHEKILKFARSAGLPQDQSSQKILAKNQPPIRTRQPRSTIMLALHGRTAQPNDPPSP
jgi:hypothetical protein